MVSEKVENLKSLQHTDGQTDAVLSDKKNSIPAKNILL
jgi:hypothetical protein